jgi:hypothetical protein
MGFSSCLRKALRLVEMAVLRIQPARLAAGVPRALWMARLGQLPGRLAAQQVEALNRAPIAPPDRKMAQQVRSLVGPVYLVQSHPRVERLHLDRAG